MDLSRIIMPSKGGVLSVSADQIRFGSFSLPAAPRVLLDVNYDTIATSQTLTTGNYLTTVTAYSAEECAFKCSDYNYTR